MPICLCKRELNFLLENDEIYILRSYRNSFKGDVYHDWVLDCETRKRVAKVTVEYMGKVAKGEEGWIVHLSAPIHVLNVEGRDTPNIIDKLKLETFVEKSAFDSVEEWVNAVKEYNKGKLPGTLYLFELDVVYIKPTWYKRSANPHYVGIYIDFDNTDRSRSDDMISKSRFKDMIVKAVIFPLELFTFGGGDRNVVT